MVTKQVASTGLADMRDPFHLKVELYVQAAVAMTAVLEVVHHSSAAHDLNEEKFTGSMLALMV